MCVYMWVVPSRTEGMLPCLLLAVLLCMRLLRLHVLVSNRLFHVLVFYTFPLTRSMFELFLFFVLVRIRKIIVASAVCVLSHSRSFGLSHSLSLIYMFSLFTLPPLTLVPYT